ncbi:MULTISPECIES: fumarate reductase subunit FrdD [unclassified Geodermatophilus]|uniref:fumarate reductase subunit FrdD n=1 Tax=unclassified Geodermatophilus TaxID=2637632 RepID=UPI003EEEBDD7
MTRRRVEPLVWLMFSAGGVLAAVFLPSLILVFGLALPLGWLDPPDHGDVLAVVGHPVTVVVLVGAFVLLLVHSAHRFRYTLYDGLQIKKKRTVAVLCYGAAIVGSVATLAVLLGAAGG